MSADRYIQNSRSVSVSDVTDALKEGENQFTILCERYRLNELGAGGLMGPVVIYRDK